MNASNNEGRGTGKTIGMAPVLLATILWGLALAILVLTFLPLWNTNIWWVRIMAFPRLQIGVIGVLVLVAALFLSSQTGC